MSQQLYSTGCWAAANSSPFDFCASSSILWRACYLRPAAHFFRPHLHPSHPHFGGLAALFCIGRYSPRRHPLACMPLRVPLRACSFGRFCLSRSCFAIIANADERMSVPSLGVLCQGVHCTGVCRCVQRLLSPTIRGTCDVPGFCVTAVRSMCFWMLCHCSSWDVRVLMSAASFAPCMGSILSQPQRLDIQTPRRHTG